MSLPHDNAQEPSSNAEAVSTNSSDNDANERPVREKLRETSIASKIELYDRSDQVVGKIESKTLPDEVRPVGTPPQSPPFFQRFDQTRGRPNKKRSFDDLETAEIAEPKVLGSQEDESSEHFRKRSKDAQSAEPSHRGRHTVARLNSRSEASTDRLSANDEPSRTYEQVPSERSASLEEREDLILTEAAFSPRRKRSREQVDTDVQREQKIAATEETKASRRSDEVERPEKRSRDDEAPVSALDGPSFDNLQNTSGTLSDPSLGRNARGNETEQRATRSLAAITDAASSKSEQSTLPKQRSADVQPGNDAFSNSGLAAFANTATSGFGVLGSSLSSEIGRRVFSASSTSKTISEGQINAMNGSSTTPIGVFSSSKLSSFASMSTTDSLGASPFSSARFTSTPGGSSSGAPGLSSFAASKGDITLGKSKVKEPIFGAPDKEDKNGSNPGSNEDPDGPSESFDAASNLNSKFQHKEVDTGEEGEESIYVNSRASLFGFGEGKWRERGKGVFKLNVKAKGIGNPDHESDRRSARFIMRAHQTHRVLLNTPIFKEMKFGDAQGKKPSNKTITFAVADEEKLIPYSLRLSDSNEARILYQTVKTLQMEL